MRQIVLDTETTGLDWRTGDRVIEIGCVEMVDRKLTGRHYHVFINPDRDIDAGAVEVHGITSEFLADKPRFKDVVAEFEAFVRDGELVIHNAAFDVGFLNHELEQAEGSHPRIEELCGVVDTLLMARKKHPGQRNSLDALCKRYEVDNSQRELHGALLDAEILADVYLLMTGGQTTLQLTSDESGEGQQEGGYQRRERQQHGSLPLALVSEEDLEAHSRFLERINKLSNDRCVWTAQAQE